MRLYITDKDKITKYLLPEKVEESFLFSYFYNGNEYYLNIISKDRKWYLKNGKSFKVANHPSNDLLLLDNRSIYPMEISDIKSSLHLYCLPDIDNESTYYQSINNIKIGNDPAGDIVLKSASIVPNLSVITFQNNTWYIEGIDNELFPIYLNDKRIIKSKLKLGDIIFINGLKIIWMNTFFKLNKPNIDLAISSNLNLKKEGFTQDNNQYSPLDEDDEENIKLYNENDYFSHQPRLRVSIVPKELKIDAPPQAQIPEDVPFLLSIGSSFTMLIFSGVSGYTALSAYFSKQKTFGEIVPSLLICVAMLFGAFIVPQLLKRYKKKKAKEKEIFRQKKYGEYLDKKEKEICFILSDQNQILNNNYLNTKECAEMVILNKSRVWEREITDSDFLSIRVGLGNVNAFLKIESPEESFTLFEDNLMQRVYQIVGQSRQLINVPVVVSLVQNNIAALICNCSFATNYNEGIMLQLMAYHSSIDLKICIFTSEDNAFKWDYLKNSSHCWNNQNTIRFFATNIEEMKTIGSYLNGIYRQRIETINQKKEEENEEHYNENLYRNYKPYYLIIVDNYQKARMVEFINTIQSGKENLGFTLLIVSNSLKNLPNTLKKIIYVLEDNSCILDKELAGENQQNFQAEYNQDLEIKQVVSALAKIPIATEVGESTLPKELPFLEMFGVGNIDQLNILNRWNISNPMISLETPVGVHSSGEKFKLDLHEKYAGPHGLIAGTTGSGKSEFIITYILSMAINYHPYEVQFVLIDYKGGGLAGAFENRETGVSIPHLVGTITNLDTSEMNRTLVSINSELRRRQRMFNKVRDQLGESTIDIYKYQKLYREGVIDEPISHLFIISDEFAELKSQQPDFMAELISTARIGRSLGVHLILATQKPSGVVNDQIWSNTRFRVCLKVQNRSDSNEMLKRPEAAYLKEAGRFYLQVGADEIFELGQSAWCGAKYYPSEKLNKKIDNSMNFINNVGGVIKSIDELEKNENKQACGEQLTNVVRYLSAIAKKENLKLTKLWLEKIPSLIYIGNLKQKYNYQALPYIIKPIIGEYDCPANQVQGPLVLDLSENGNTIIYGKLGSGKELVLKSIITSIVTEHKVEECNFYIMDFGSESLRIFNQYPHVGDIVVIDEVEKVSGLISTIIGEINRRKELMSNYTSFSEYNQKNDNKLPAIIVIINLFEVFTENFPRLTDRLGSIFRDCTKYGISFILTTTAANGIGFRLIQYFNNKLVLQMSNEDDYRNIINAPRKFTPSKVFGRGLTKVGPNVNEFQTAYINKPEQLNDYIRELGVNLKNINKNIAPKIPTLPKYVLSEDISYNVTDFSNLGIGINKKTLKPYYFNFKKKACTPILSMNIEEHLNFVYAIAKEMHNFSNIKIRVLDILGIYKNELLRVEHYKNNFDDLIKKINIEVSRDKDITRPNIFIIVGISKLKQTLNPETLPIYENMFKNIANCKNNYFLLLDNYNSYRNFENEVWYGNSIDNQHGIWLGEGAGDQMSLKGSMQMEERKIYFNDIAVVFDNNKVVFIKHVVDKVEEENEE